MPVMIENSKFVVLMAVFSLSLYVSFEDLLYNFIRLRPMLTGFDKLQNKPYVVVCLTFCENKCLRDDPIYKTNHII